MHSVPKYEYIIFFIANVHLLNIFVAANISSIIDNYKYTILQAIAILISDHRIAKKHY